MIKTASNGRFRKMAALSRGERYFVIFAAWLAWKMCGSRHLAKPLDRCTQAGATVQQDKNWRELDIKKYCFRT